MRRALFSAITNRDRFRNRNFPSEDPISNRHYPVADRPYGAARKNVLPEREPVK